MTQVIYPQQKEEAGAHYWAVLYNTAAQYPQYPTRDDKLDTNNFIKSTIKRFTCQSCIEHAFSFMRQHPTELDNRESLMKWVCQLHNNANIHAGKPTVNCDDFVLNSLNRSDDAGCKSCQIETIKAPSVNINAATPVTRTNNTNVSSAIVPKPPSAPLDPEFESVLNWNKRYPSLKKSINIEKDEKVSIGTSPTDLAAEYPSLAGLDTEFASAMAANREEEMDGILKPLDSIYAFPARMVDLEPYEFNLAYTPEMLTNTVTLLTQMYLTNFGSLLTTVVSSLSLLAASVFAKNSLSHYDRLFLQNTTASMMFHALNFINPRIKDEVIPSATKFFEGLTSMNVEKIKESILFGHKGPETKDAEALLDMLKEHDGIVDMEKIGKGYSARDIQNISQMGSRGMGMSNVPGDLRTVSGAGFGGTGGSVTKNELERMFNDRGRYSSSTLKSPDPNYDVIGASQDRFSYILDNNLI